MKLTKYLFFLFICLFISACSDDKNDDGGGGGENPDRTETQAWIEDHMRENYYWYSEIKSADKLDYESEPKAFFKSLLSSKDGKGDGGPNHQYYSYILNLAESRSQIKESNSYGFEFYAIYADNTHTDVWVLVQYVLKDSPAGEAGLKRGDWIIEINGKPFTTKDNTYSALYSGGEAMSLTVARWDAGNGVLALYPDKINVGPSQKVVDNPIHIAKTLTSSNGKKVGYLLYNHFSAGTGNDNDFSYDDKLREESMTTFNGVEEFVLDLRYNNGGLLSSARTLCAILAPKNALEKKFGSLKYNDKKKNSNWDFTVGKEQLTEGSKDYPVNVKGQNLNLSRIYILTSDKSASSSEMVINSLRPYMEVVLIGQQTVGKNVGSIPEKSKDELWEMHPIVCQLANSEGFTDYSEGFKPDYEIDEAFAPTEKPNEVRLIQVHELGERDERLLNAAMLLIEGKAVASRSTLTPEGPTYTRIPFNSIDRKATNGVIIDQSEE